MALAKVNLRKQGITIKTIREKKKYSRRFDEEKVSTLDITIFTRQLATMMKAGVPLVQGFEIVAEGLENPSMREVVLGIKGEVEGGNTFAGALRKYPQYFDNLFCSLVESGEQSGALETMLDRVAIYKEKSELLKQKLKSHEIPSHSNCSSCDRHNYPDGESSSCIPGLILFIRCRLTCIY